MNLQRLKFLFEPPPKLGQLQLVNQTVAVIGPEEMTLGEIVKRVAHVMRRPVLLLHFPVMFHYFLSWWLEQLMMIPLIASAQVRILSEGAVEALPPCDSLPVDLTPQRSFTEQQIKQGLPEVSRFGMADCRLQVWSRK